MIFSDMKSRYGQRTDFPKYTYIKRLWSISLENYTDYVGKVKKFRKSLCLQSTNVKKWSLTSLEISDIDTVKTWETNVPPQISKYFSKIFSPSHIKLSDNNLNKDFTSVERP